MIVAKVALAELAGVGGLLAVQQIQWVNTAMNVVGLIGLLVGLYSVPKAFKASTMKAELEEKDRIIKGRSELAQVAEAELGKVREKCAELGVALDEERAARAAADARYEEQSRYTAGPALEAIQELMQRQERENNRRHREMLLALRALRALRPGADLEEDEAEMRADALHPDE